MTIKDTLEGDNMYTCSQCGKKVRAEKRSDPGSDGAGGPPDLRAARPSAAG